MASTGRRRIRAGKRIATAGATTATVTAIVMTTATTPLANAEARLDQARASTSNAALVGNYASALVGSPTALAATPGSPGLPPMQLAPGAPDPASIPDLTFGLGTGAYDAFQAVATALDVAILDNYNLSGLLEALGYNPEELVNNALGTAITQLLAGISVDLSGIPVVGTFLSAAQIDNALQLTQLIGLNLSDPLNLAGVAAPGLNIITTGPPLSLLKFLGVDLNEVPGYPNAVAEAINGTPYLDVAAAGVLGALIPGIQQNPNLSVFAKATLIASLNVLIAEVGGIDIIDLRIPIVAGFGLGAFAAGMAYPQVVDQLAGQPGGEGYTDDIPLLGSVTVLPLALLRNPGRANGGFFARFYPLAALAGIDTVTPDTEVSSSFDPDVPPLSQAGGLAVGGANLIPIKLDVTDQYDALSDFPSWFNPVSLLNAAAAELFPEYILRGQTVNGAESALADQATTQIDEALANLDAGDPLALNLYLTLPADSLPLLEVIRLPVDLLNQLTGANFNNPLATALEPALKILTNLGFTDVDQENGYERTLDQGDVITPFGTVPSNVDWNRVPGDVFQALLTGIEQAWHEGIISPVQDDEAPVDEEPAPEASALAPNGTAPPDSDAESSDGAEPSEAPRTRNQLDATVERDAKRDQLTTSVRDVVKSGDVTKKSRPESTRAIREHDHGDEDATADEDESDPDDTERPDAGDDAP